MEKCARSPEDSDRLTPLRFGYLCQSGRKEGVRARSIRFVLVPQVPIPKFWSPLACVRAIRCGGAGGIYARSAHFADVSSLGRTRNFQLHFLSDRL